MQLIWCYQQPRPRQISLSFLLASAALVFMRLDHSLLQALQVSSWVQSGWVPMDTQKEWQCPDHPGCWWWMTGDVLLFFDCVAILLKCCTANHHAFASSSFCFFCLNWLFRRIFFLRISFRRLPMWVTIGLGPCFLDHRIPSSTAPTHKWSDPCRIWVLECNIRRNTVLYGAKKIKKEKEKWKTMKMC